MPRSGELPSPPKTMPAWQRCLIFLSVVAPICGFVAIDVIWGGLVAFSAVLYTILGLCVLAVGTILFWVIASFVWWTFTGHLPFED